ncbi:glycoside hydrolase family 25 protein [Saccharothrix sp. AJ9571]|nr:glycoside hydrolase family 25 protein [Saccharothrix sp. AJ9571]
MVLFGLDISHHQGDRDQAWFHAVYAAGVRFIIVKATEGATFTDKRFAQNLARAEAAGLIVLAYVYQRAGASAGAHVDRIRQVVPKRIPIIPDVEKGAGSLDHTRAIIAQLRGAGYTVPLVYLPGWYWQEIGKPSLHGLPPNWKSRYPDNSVDDLADEYADVPAHYWDPIGNNAAGWLPTAVLQFTSSASVAGYAPLDGNAFRGSLAQFTALIGGTPAAPESSSVHITEESTVELSPGIYVSKTLVCPSDPSDLVISLGFVSFTVHHIKFFGPTPETGHAELAAYGEQRVDPARPYVKPAPAGALTAEVLYSLEAAEGNESQHTAVAAFRGK